MLSLHSRVMCLFSALMSATVAFAQWRSGDNKVSISLSCSLLLALGCSLPCFYFILSLYLNSKPIDGDTAQANIVISVPSQGSCHTAGFTKHISTAMTVKLFPADMLCTKCTYLQWQINYTQNTSVWKLKESVNTAVKVYKKKKITKMNFLFFCSSVIRGNVCSKPFKICISSRP